MPVNAFDYALVLGINHYPGIKDRSLKGAIRDAEQFRDWLHDTTLGGGVPTANVETVLSTGSPVTPLHDQVDEALDRLVQRAKEHGSARRFYFFFSGHGIAQIEQERTPTAFCLGKWTEHWRNYALDSDCYVNYIVNTQRFAEVILFADCCRIRKFTVYGRCPAMGNIAPGTAPSTVRQFRAHATELMDFAYEAAAASGSEVRGHFSRALLNGLWGAAAEPGGGVKALRLKEYPRKRSAAPREAGQPQAEPGDRAGVRHGGGARVRIGVTGAGAGQRARHVQPHNSGSDRARRSGDRHVPAHRRQRWDVAVEPHRRHVHPEASERSGLYASSSTRCARSKMSTPESRTAVSLFVTGASGDAVVVVYDAGNHEVARQTGAPQMQLWLPRGFYTLRVNVGADFGEMFIRLNADTTIGAPVPARYSSAPLANGALTHEYYSQTSAVQSREKTRDRLTESSLPSAELFVFVRALDRERYKGADLGRDLQLLNDKGGRISGFAADVTKRDTEVRLARLLCGSRARVLPPRRRRRTAARDCRSPVPQLADATVRAPPRAPAGREPARFHVAGEHGLRTGRRDRGCGGRGAVGAAVGIRIRAGGDARSLPPQQVPEPDARIHRRAPADSRRARPARTIRRSAASARR